MSSFNHWQSGTFALIALVMSATTAVPLLPLAPASAQLFSSQRTLLTTSNRVVIPAGTQIPLKYDKAEKILVTEEETIPLTLTVAANIKNRNGTILIPYNSEIFGQIKPSGDGSQFVAQTLILTDGTQVSLDETSGVVTTTETIEQGASADDILKGAVIGASAASVIAAITGDTAIAPEEVLGGAGLGILAGWVWGGSSAELISINPNIDLDLTLRSDLTLTPSS